MKAIGKIKYNGKEYPVYSDTFQTGGSVGTPTDYFELPALLPSDFDYTTDRSRGNARYFSDPITGEPFPLVNLPEAMVGEDRTPFNQLSNQSLLAGVSQAKPWFEAGNKEMGYKVLREREEDLQRASLINEFTGIPAMGRTADRIQNDPADLFTFEGGLDALSFIPSTILANKGLKSIGQSSKLKKPKAKPYSEMTPEEKYEVFLENRLKEYKKLQKFSETSVETINKAKQRAVNALMSPEGKTRYYNMLKDIDPDLNDFQLELLYTNTLNEINNVDKFSYNNDLNNLLKQIDNPNFDNSEHFEYDVEGYFLENKIPDNNAYAKQLDAKYFDNWSNDFSKYYYKEIKRRSQPPSINLRKGLGFAPENSTAPITRDAGIVLGTKYANNINVAMHELGHVLQKWGTVPFDEQLLKLAKTEDGDLKNLRKLDDSLISNMPQQYQHGIEDASDYFINSGERTIKSEPFAFMVEQRNAMLESGLIKNYYDKITPELLQKQYNISRKNIEYPKDNNVDFSLLGGNRLVHIFKPDAYPELAKIMNEAPLSVIGAAGVAGAAAAGSKMKQIIPPDFKKGGVIVDPQGQYNHPGQTTLIPTPKGHITMKGIKYPVYAIDNTGHEKLMMPDQEYVFPGTEVLEIPLNKKQLGGGYEESILSIDDMFMELPPKTKKLKNSVGEEIYTYDREQKELVDLNKLLHRQAYAESTFNTEALSPAGAYGLTQIMPNTLDFYKSKTKDDSIDLSKAEDAVKVQKWVMQNYSEKPFINNPNQSDKVRWAKTLAAYNMGPTGFKNFLEKQKASGVDIYSDDLSWIDSLPKETKGYLEKILLESNERFNTDYDKNKSQYEDLYFRKRGGQTSDQYLGKFKLIGNKLVKIGD